MLSRNRASLVYRAPSSSEPQVLGTARFASCTGQKYAIQLALQHTFVYTRLCRVIWGRGRGSCQQKGKRGSGRQRSALSKAACAAPQRGARGPTLGRGGQKSEEREATFLEGTGPQTGVISCVVDRERWATVSKRGEGPVTPGSRGEF